MIWLEFCISFCCCFFLFSLSLSLLLPFIFSFLLCVLVAFYKIIVITNTTMVLFAVWFRVLFVAAAFAFRLLNGFAGLLRKSGGEKKSTTITYRLFCARVCMYVFLFCLCLPPSAFPSSPARILNIHLSNRPNARFLSPKVRLLYPLNLHCVSLLSSSSRRR